MRESVERCDFRQGDRVCQYRIDRTLGEGAFGKVFKVRDPSGHTYALKLLKLWEIEPSVRAQLVARFDMEYETGQISSHYLVHSIDHGFVSGNPYIVMEFCPGGDLMQATTVSNPDLVKAGKEILYGLKDLHRCGKVHRDLKPENVLIKEDGSAVLTDFGISGDRNRRLTNYKMGQIFGTYAYMPPEQISPPHKEATVLPTTDIFSFGVMMFQLITGDLPFGPLESENDLVRYIQNGREGRWDRRSLKSTGMGESFSVAIEGCLAPDFKQRLQTVDAVLARMPQGASGSYKSKTGQSMASISIRTGVLLRVMQGEEYGQTYKLNELLLRAKIITMGRQTPDVPNVIPVREEQSCYISRRHCTLEVDHATGQWYIRDGQWDRSAPHNWRHSLNGTFVNSTEVSFDGLPIKPGDIISIGDVKLRVEGY
ncbi:MAG: protein kinase [Prevotellaceae bacterium]|jgi:serine/threonine protein kinase|nr:protein kinase [Prevotellaceae bacterium]